MENLMPQPHDSSRSLVPFEHDATLVAVVELSQSSWLIAGSVPGLDRQPLKKIAPDEVALLRVLHRWRDEVAGRGHTIKRIAVAFEAGCDGFWLARWLKQHGVESHVIPSAGFPDGIGAQEDRAFPLEGLARGCAAISVRGPCAAGSGPFLSQ
jgi:transposase